MKQETYNKLTDMLNEAISKETPESWNAYLDSCQTETDKAADDYVGHPKEVDEDLSISMSRKAFKDGANWHRTHSWHKPTDIPQPNISGLIVIYKDSTLGFINMIDVIPNLNLKSVSDGWAYLKDILPNNEQDT